MIEFVKRLSKEELKIVNENMTDNEFLNAVWLDHTKEEKEEWCICIESYDDEDQMELLESDYDTEDEAVARIREIEEYWREIS